MVDNSALLLPDEECPDKLGGRPEPSSNKEGGPVLKMRKTAEEVTTKDGETESRSSFVTPSGYGRELTTEMVHTNGWLTDDVFAGPQVATLPTLNKTASGKEVLVPPPGWWRKAEYKPIWPGPFGEAQGNSKWNRKAKRLCDFAWDLTGISTSLVRVHEGQLRELLLLSWSPAWVPDRMLQPDARISALSYKRIEEFKALHPRVRTQVSKRVRAQHIEFLLDHSDTLPEEYHYYVSNVFEAAVFGIQGTMILAVRVEFLRSWEHCGHLAKNRELWEQVMIRRLECINGKDFKWKMHEAVCDMRKRCEAYLGMWKLPIGPPSSTTSPIEIVDEDEEEIPLVMYYSDSE